MQAAIFAQAAKIKKVGREDRDADGHLYMSDDDAVMATVEKIAGLKGTKTKNTSKRKHDFKLRPKKAKSCVNR